MDSAAESTLIRLTREGSHAAFAELVQRHQRVVRAYLSRYFQDDNEVDEVAQRAFVEAYRSIEGFQGRSRFSSWLVGIARRQAIRIIRDEARRRKHETIASELLLNMRDGDSVADGGEVEAKLRSVLTCIHRLAPRSREAVENFYFQHASVEAIAQSQGRTNGAIRMLLMRSRKALAACITKELVESGDRS